MPTVLAASHSAASDPLAPYTILDTLPEQAYNDIVLIAAQICDTPIALISFADGERLWFKSVLGWDVSEIALNDSFCVHAFQQPTEILQVIDATIDDRFRANPLVTNDPHIRFYAGAPLITTSGDTIGAMCVIDRIPRVLTARQLETLQALAHQVMTQLELRRTVKQLREAELQLEEYQHQLEQALVKLDAENGQDALTGAHNRRFFDARLADEVERAVRYHMPLSLLLLDVDHFKSYNDNFGHPAGDKLLQRLGQILRAISRSHDVVARYGGEEFAVILPNTSSDQAFALAERLRQGVMGMADANRPITISIGIASVNAVLQDKAALVEAADQGLYLAKRQGRNRAVEAIHRLQFVDQDG